MNCTSNYQFTIIIPVYNEQDNIIRLESELSSYLKTAKMKSCVLFVNDGSSDESEPMLRDVCSRHNDMFYLSFDKNRGLSAALKAGIDFSFSDYIGYIDADLQTTPEDFNILLEYATQYAMVMGIRTQRKDSFVKRFSSRFANGFRKMMTNDKAIDTGCPLKVIKKEYAKRLPLFNGMHRFLPALILLQTDGDFMQVSVRHFPRIAGKSKYNMWNRMIGPLLDCFAYRWMKKRYINYSVSSTNLCASI